MTDELLSRCGWMCVSYHDDNALWPVLEETLYQYLPLRQGSTTVKIPALTCTFVSDKDDQLKEPPVSFNWWKGAHIHLYLLKCETIDEYKSSAKALLAAWIDTMAKRQQEWLIVFMPMHTHSSSAKRYRKLLDKIRADFCSRRNQQRCVVIDTFDQSPRRVSTGAGDKKAEPGSGQWLAFIEQLQACIVATLTTRVKAYNVEIRRRWEQRNLPGWNYSTYFCLKESLAFVYAQAYLPQEALRQYDELEATYFELSNADGTITGLQDSPMLADRVVGGQFAPESNPREGSGGAGGDGVSTWQGLKPSPHLLDLSHKPYRDLIATNKASLFDFRHYLFARQCHFLMQLGRTVRLIDRAASFIVTIVNMGVRHVAAGHVPQEVLNEWVFCACMDMVEVCQQSGLGFGAGSMSDAVDGPSSLSSPGRPLLATPSRADAVTRSRTLGELLLLARQHLSRVLTGAGVLDGTGNPLGAPSPAVKLAPAAMIHPHSASALALRTALDSQDDAENLFLRVTGLAAMHLQHGERFRYAQILETDRARLLMRRGQHKDALPLLRAQVSRFRAEGWEMLFCQSVSLIAECERTLAYRADFVRSCLELLDPRLEHVLAAEDLSRVVGTEVPEGTPPGDLQGLVADLAATWARGIATDLETGRLDVRSASPSGWHAEAFGQSGPQWGASLSPTSAPVVHTEFGRPVTPALPTSESPLPTTMAQPDFGEDGLRVTTQAPLPTVVTHAMQPGLSASVQVGAAPVGDDHEPSTPPCVRAGEGHDPTRLSADGALEMAVTLTNRLGCSFACDQVRVELSRAPPRSRRVSAPRPPEAPPEAPTLVGGDAHVWTSACSDVPLTQSDTAPTAGWFHAPTQTPQPAAVDHPAVNCLQRRWPLLLSSLDSAATAFSPTVSSGGGGAPPRHPDDGPPASTTLVVNLSPPEGGRLPPGDTVLRVTHPAILSGVYVVESVCVILGSLKLVQPCAPVTGVVDAPGGVDVRRGSIGGDLPTGPSSFTVLPLPHGWHVWVRLPRATYPGGPFGLRVAVMPSNRLSLCGCVSVGLSAPLGFRVSRSAAARAYRVTVPATGAHSGMRPPFLVDDAVVTPLSETMELAVVTDGSTRRFVVDLPFPEEAVVTTQADGQQAWLLVMLDFPVLAETTHSVGMAPPGLKPAGEVLSPGTTATTATSRSTDSSSVFSPGSPPSAASSVLSPGSSVLSPMSPESGVRSPPATLQTPPANVRSPAESTPTSSAPLDPTRFEVAVCGDASSAYTLRRFGLVEPRLTVPVQKAFDHTYKLVSGEGGRTFLQVLLRPTQRKQPLLLVDYTLTVTPTTHTDAFVLNRDSNAAFRGAVVNARNQLAFGFEIGQVRGVPEGQHVDAVLIVQYRVRPKSWVRRHSRRLSITGVVGPEVSQDVNDDERALPALRTLHEYQARVALPHSE